MTESILISEQILKTDLAKDAQAKEGHASSESESVSIEQLEKMLADTKSALLGRASFYDLLASIYFKPLSEAQIENIASLDFSPYKNMNDDFEQGINDMMRYLKKRNTGTRQELAVDFTSAFAGTSSWEGRYAVPYESVFTSPEGLLFQDAYHKVHKVFEENHVQRKKGYDFPDDHVSFMCEFQSILSQRAIEACDRRDFVDVRRQIETAKWFLEEHMLSWFGDFHETALLILQTRFYRGVLKITRGFFSLDLDLTKDLIIEFRLLCDEGECIKVKF